MTQVTNTPFAVSDKVVHPKHGPGMITGVETLDVMAQPRQYYVIDIFDKALIVRVPVGKAIELGLRPIMSDSQLADVFGTLRDLPQELPEDYKQRQLAIRERLRARDPVEVAGAVRDLYWHGELAHLTKTDAQLLSQGRDLLAAEMISASGSDPSIIIGRLDAALLAAAVQDQFPSH